MEGEDEEVMDSFHDTVFTSSVFKGIDTYGDIMDFGKNTIVPTLKALTKSDKVGH